MERTRRRASQRDRPRFTPDSSVASPCVGICWLDDKTNLCEGCKRSPDEIRDWIIMTAEQKRTVLSLLAER